MCGQGLGTVKSLTNAETLRPSLEENIQIYKAKMNFVEASRCFVAMVICSSYVTVIYASFFVYLGIILVLASTFIPAIVDSSATTGGGSMSIGNLTIREMNEVWISTMFLYSLMVQGMGNGLAAGFMSSGRLYSAFLRASFLLLLGWFIFELTGIATSMITPQI